MNSLSKQRLKAEMTRERKKKEKKVKHALSTGPLSKPQFRVYLAELGFENYAAYLDSELWKQIRGRVLGASGRCVRCRQGADQVHHVVYSRANLSGQSTKGMVPICRSCHRKIEFTDGVKNKLSRANAILFTREVRG